VRELLNQNSFVLTAVAVLAVLWFVFGRVLRRFMKLIVAAVVVLLVVAALALRTGSSDVASGTELDRVLAKGKPVALEFYSNF
jgi:Mn2+/Fe2+ NRAMP family transporter